MPTWNCPPLAFRRAVESVLAQEHKNLQLVVTNDGDSRRVWETLDNIRDSRLIRFNLGQNRGRFYADAVVLAACETPLFAVHDSDDWSEPGWLSDLVAHASEDGIVAAFSAQTIHHGSREAVEETHPMLVRRDQVDRLSQLAHHAGVYWTESIRAAGGPHPGYRIGYDTMLVNLVRMVGACAASTEHNYHRVARLNSLTTSRQTGFGSAARRAVQAKLRVMYQRALSTPPSGIGEMVRNTIPHQLELDLAKDAARLRTML